MTLWEQVLARLEGKVNPHSFATWFRPTQYADLREGTMRVRVPNPQFRDWLGRNYHGVITEALNDLGRSDVPKVMGGLGTSILTTSQGVMTGREAVKAGVGGEVLCNVW